MKGYTHMQLILLTLKKVNMFNDKDLTRVIHYNGIQS